MIYDNSPIVVHFCEVNEKMRGGVNGHEEQKYLRRISLESTFKATTRALTFYLWKD